MQTPACGHTQCDIHTHTTVAYIHTHTHTPHLSTHTYAHTRGIHILPIAKQLRLSQRFSSSKLVQKSVENHWPVPIRSTLGPSWTCTVACTNTFADTHAHVPYAPNRNTQTQNTHKCNNNDNTHTRTSLMYLFSNVFPHSYA